MHSQLTSKDLLGHIDCHGVRLVFFQNCLLDFDEAIYVHTRLMAVSLGGVNSGANYRRELCGVGGSTNVFPFPLQYKLEKETDGSDGHPQTTTQDL